MKITESLIKAIIKECAYRLLKENEVGMGPYNGYRIENVDLEPYLFTNATHLEDPDDFFPNRYGYKGMIVVFFPNTDGTDVDEREYVEFSVYDKMGAGYISLDCWYPEEIQKKLKERIREEIQKRDSGISKKNFKR